jgi:hypothetical protein
VLPASSELTCVDIENSCITAGPCRLVSSPAWRLDQAVAYSETTCVHRVHVNEGVSSSHSDVGCYVIIRKLLDFIFNSRVHMQVGIYNYRRISFRKVADTICDVSRFEDLCEVWGRVC